MNDKTKLEFQNEVELKYALFKDSIVHISEVSSGLNLNNYRCPKCNSFLIAKKGDIRVHHFAHYNYENCQGAQETALHKLAKEILLQEKVVAIPNINNPEQWAFIEFDEVKQEVRVFNLIVDVLGYFNNNELAIEIKVTHEVDLRKIAVVKEKEIDMIEIDLSSYVNTDLSRDELTTIVIETAPRYWINTPTIQTTEEDNKMSNKVKAMGFISAYGYSRKNNSNFEMSKIYVMQPIEKKATQNFTVTACAGYDLTDFEMDDNRDLHDKLETFDFPCDAVLTFGIKLKGNKPITIVTDVNLT
jgi:hypothetical protein